jgi:2-keto-3-deoxy-L-fuconate dehydrogenase
MTLSVAKEYISQGIRCNCISPARVHTPFVDGFVAKNYPGHGEFHGLKEVTIKIGNCTHV